MRISKMQANQANLGSIEGPTVGFTTTIYSSCFGSVLGGEHIVISSSMSSTRRKGDAGKNAGRGYL